MIKPLIALTLALPLLASCGSVVGAAIPAQTINNPGNLEGQSLTASQAFTPQGVGTTLTVDTGMIPGAAFDDFTFPDLPFGIRPSTLAFTFSFSTLTLTGPCVGPDSFTLNFGTLDLSFWNSGDRSSAQTLPSTPNVSVTATRQSGGAGVTTYALSAAGVSTGGNAAGVLNVLTTGGKNDASLSMRLSADPSALTGCVPTLKIGAAKAVVSNFR